MEKISILDLNGVSNLEDLHNRIKKALNFPDYYGKNWNAFWDLLCCECDADKVIVKGEKSLPKELENAVKIMHEILEENKQFWINSKCPFDYEIID